MERMTIITARPEELAHPIRVSDPCVFWFTIAVAVPANIRMNVPINSAPICKHVSIGINQKNIWSSAFFALLCYQFSNTEKKLVFLFAFTLERWSYNNVIDLNLTDFFSPTILQWERAYELFHLVVSNWVV